VPTRCSARCAGCFCARAKPVAPVWHLGRSAQEPEPPARRSPRDLATGIDAGEIDDPVWSVSGRGTAGAFRSSRADSGPQPPQGGPRCGGPLRGGPLRGGPLRGVLPVTCGVQVLRHEAAADAVVKSLGFICDDVAPGGDPHAPPYPDGLRQAARVGETSFVKYPADGESSPVRRRRPAERARAPKRAG
jgi:hypothetical protein